MNAEPVRGVQGRMRGLAIAFLACLILPASPAFSEGEPGESQEKPASLLFTGDLDIAVRSNASGGVAAITILGRPSFTGPASARNLQTLDLMLRDLLKLLRPPAKRFIIRADKSLKYDELRKVFNVCTGRRWHDGTLLTDFRITEIVEVQQPTFQEKSKTVQASQEPVPGSLRRLDTRGKEDTLELIIAAEGAPMSEGMVDDISQAIAEAGRAAQEKAKAKNPKFERGQETLSTTLVVRADKETPFSRLSELFDTCHKAGYRKISLQETQRE